MSMVEKVARAITRCGIIDGDGEQPWIDNEVNGTWHLAIDTALAAIEAMREPTPEMVAEVENASRIGAIWTAQSAWQAMIDAALEEKP